MLAREHWPQRLQETRCIGVIAYQRSIAAPHDRVHGANPLRQRVETVKMQNDRLLMRHGYVTAAPSGVFAAFVQVSGHVLRPDQMRAVLATYPELAEPEVMNARRFRLSDRIANYFGIRPCHAGSFPNSRSAPSTSSNGMPRTVNISPSMLSNSCTPSDSIRKTPTHWLTSGHSATK